MNVMLSNTFLNDKVARLRIYLPKDRDMLYPHSPDIVSLRKEAKMTTTIELFGRPSPKTLDSLKTLTDSNRLKLEMLRQLLEDNPTDKIKRQVIEILTTYSLDALFQLTEHCSPLKELLREPHHEASWARFIKDTSPVYKLEKADTPAFDRLMGIYLAKQYSIWCKHKRADEEQALMIKEAAESRRVIPIDPCAKIEIDIPTTLALAVRV